MKRRLWAFAAALGILGAGCVQTDLSDQRIDLTAQQPSSSQAASQPEEQLSSELRLAYYPDDSLNPYQMKTALNRQLVTLLYDSLTRPSHSWEAQLLVASDIVADAAGLVYTVRCKPQVLHSDGSRVTGADVVYSAGLARAPGSLWAVQLQNVAEVLLDEAGNAQFRLYRKDIDFPVLLSFPIVKEGTGEADFPVGVSRFFVSGTRDGAIYLEPNPIYFQKQGSAQHIRLVGVADSGTLSFLIKTGEVDFAYSDLSIPEIASLSPSNSSVSLNHLVFLGVNGTRGVLAMPEFRHALSLAFNRDQLVAHAYVGRGDACIYPVHPAFHRLEGIEAFTPSDLTRAETLLDGLGLSEKNADGWRLYQNKPVELNLLVNSENSMRGTAAALLADQLAGVGVKINVVSKSFSQYQNDLLTANYDLYIGETRLMDNMDFSALLGGGGMGYSTAYSEQLTERLQGYRATGEQMRELCEMFAAQSPFIPLLFRQGLVSLSESFAGTPQATEQDLFYNIANW